MDEKYFVLNLYDYNYDYYMLETTFLNNVIIHVTSFYILKYLITFVIADNSTETFWESGDEDRNKTKMITITCNSAHSPRMIYIHIDNSRDLGVSESTFYEVVSKYLECKITFTAVKLTNVILHIQIFWHLEIVMGHVTFLFIFQNKVSSVTFTAGTSNDDLKKLKQVDVESRHTGWVNTHNTVTFSKKMKCL